MLFCQAWPWRPWSTCCWCYSCCCHRYCAPEAVTSPVLTVHICTLVIFTCPLQICVFAVQLGSIWQCSHKLAFAARSRNHGLLLLTLHGAWNVQYTSACYLMLLAPFNRDSNCQWRYLVLNSLIPRRFGCMFFCLPPGPCIPQALQAVRPTRLEVAIWSDLGAGDRCHLAHICPHLPTMFEISVRDGKRQHA